MRPTRDAFRAAIHVIGPSCNRKVFTHRDMLHAVIDGAARCRSCGGNAKLDTLTRWLMSCVPAVILPMPLLFGEVFYSGHPFLISMFIIFSAWALLSVIGFPFLTVEVAADRSRSMWILAVLVAAAIVIDGCMRSRFE